MVRLVVRLFGADGKVNAAASNPRTPAVEAASAKDSLGCLLARLVVADDGRSEETVTAVRMQQVRLVRVRVLRTVGSRDQGPRISILKVHAQVTSTRPIKKYWKL
mgnify:CR=1 FL=1